MCLLCSGKPLPQSLQVLHCSNCPNLTSLPENLPPTLQRLNCYGCPNLTRIPENLPESLHRLDCSDCPDLTSLPENLPPNLQTLYCYNCPKLRSLPENLPPSLQTLYCYNCPNLTSLPENLPINTVFYGCPWLPQNSKDYPDKIPNLLVCQRSVRNRRLRKFVKLTSSQIFNEYFFHPEKRGGIWAKRQLEKFVTQ